VKFPAFGTAASKRSGCAAQLLAAALFFAANIPAYASGGVQEEVTRDFEKSFTLSGNQGFSLDHRLGQVHIHGVSGH